MNDIYSIVSRLESFDESEDIFLFIQKELRGININYISYLNINNDKCEDLFTSYPKVWTEFYRENDLFSVDPVVKRGILALTPFTWRAEDLKATAEPTKVLMLKELSRYGIRSGITIPLHSRGSGTAIFTIGFDEAQAAATMARLRNALHILALNLHAVIKTMGGAFSPPTKTVTPAEIECLFWTARGKSSWEISKITKKSEATVNFHIKNSVEKLQASNRCHAVAKAIKAGLIDI